MARQDAGEKKDAKNGKGKWVNSKGGAVQADWRTADSEMLLAAICAVSSEGGALRFGYSKDGGAYNVAVYDGGEITNEYVGATEDVSVLLRRIYETFAG